VYFPILFGMVFFILDRIAKHSFIHTGICNTGIAFGMHIPQWIFFICIGSIFFGGLIWFVKSIQTSDYIRKWAIVCIFSGALSNLIDRAIYGCVVDYLYIIPHFIWFNIADIFIFIGGIAFITSYYRKK